MTNSKAIGIIMSITGLTAGSIAAYLMYALVRRETYIQRVYM